MLFSQSLIEGKAAGMVHRTQTRTPFHRLFINLTRANAPHPLFLSSALAAGTQDFCGKGDARS